jgi:hypothetical protein
MKSIMSSKPLINIGKEFSEEVRTDITLGKIVPPIGAKLTYVNGTNPNTIYPDTEWLKTAEYTAGSYTCVDWVRIH